MIDELIIFNTPFYLMVCILHTNCWPKSFTMKQIILLVNIQYYRMVFLGGVRSPKSKTLLVPAFKIASQSFGSEVLVSFFAN